MANKRLSTIYIILAILIAIIGILAFFNIDSFEDIIPKRNHGEPFSMVLEPSFIEEGQYTNYNGIPQDINLKFTLILNKNINITYIEVKEDFIIIDREGKTSQTKVSNNIRWKKTSNNYVFYYSANSIYPNPDSLEAEGALWGCQNCFMGENYPYVFTFPITYSIDGGTKQVYTLIVKLPII